MRHYIGLIAKSRSELVFYNSMTVFTIIEWEITMLFCCIEPIMPVRYQEFIVYYH